MWLAGQEWELLPPTNVAMLCMLVNMLHEEATGRGSGGGSSGIQPRTAGTANGAGATNASSHVSASASANASDDHGKIDAELDRSSAAFQRLPAHLKPETAAELIQRTLFDGDRDRSQCETKKQS